MGQQKNTVKS